jgi:uncharacterized protein YndB with AHSA1/START domain
MSANPSAHVYEIIIGSTPENVWRALTDGEVTQKYYFNTRVESDWTVGSDFRHYDREGGLSSEGKVLAVEPLSHLKTTFEPKWIPSDGNEPSTVAWDLKPLNSSTLLKLTHANIDDATFAEAEMHVGWIYIISSMKSLLETSKALPSIYS